MIIVKKTCRSFITTLLVLILCFANSIDASAVNSVELNGLSGKHQVTGSSATGSFKIVANDNSDEIEVYKIASMDWNSGTNTYDPVVWVSEVADWIADSVKYKNNSTYSTPSALAAASAQLQTDFFKDLMGDAALVASLSQVPDAKIAKTAAVAEERDGDGDVIQEAAAAYYTISDQSFGIYGINATNDALTKVYAPLTVALVPEQSGPVGHWYLSESISANMKASSDVSVEKKINGKDVDTVQRGETVTFSVLIGYPTYANRGNFDSTYTLSFDDEMSGAFALNTDSVTISYRTSSDGEWTTLDPSYYSAIIAGAALNASGNPDSSVEGAICWGCTNYRNGGYHESYKLFSIYDGSIYKYYYYTPGAYHYLSQSTTCTSTDLNNARLLYAAQTGDTTGHSHAVRPDIIKNIFNVTFNYASIREAGISIEQVKVDYTAVVTNQCEVGVDTNTNKITMYYERDSVGTVGTIDDIVYAYTYGINLVKTDGEDASVHPAGAVFSLYREEDTYCGYGALADDDGSGYAWLSNIDGDTDKTASNNLKEIYDDTGNSYFYYEYTPATVDECANYATPHKHIVVYEKFGSSFVSTSTAAGVDVKGLDPGHYAVQEDTPPTGYNSLAEDILFEIEEIDETTANTLYSGSLKAFIDDEGITVLSGMYHMDVLNFRGLQLPSTGGIGTTIFTAFGVMLMIMALILLLRKSGKQNSRVSAAIALALAVTLVFGSSFESEAYTTIILDDIQSGRVVSGDATSSFTMTVRDVNDTISVYKIADMNANGSNYDPLEWNYSMDDWVQHSATYSSYSTPELLGAASTAVQTGFLSAATADAGLMSNLEGANKVPAADILQSVNAGVVTYTVSNLHFGMYMIVAENTALGKYYQPVTVAVIPTQEGPSGHWYLQDSYYTTLKYESLKIDKEIRNDTVYGETWSDSTVTAYLDQVSFRITAEVPDYPEKDPEDTSKYPYNISDIMADGFDFRIDDGNGNMVQSTATFQYTIDDANWEALPAAAYFAINDYSAGSTSNPGLSRYTNGADEMFVKYYVDSSSVNHLIWFAYNDSTGQLTKLKEMTGTNALVSRYDTITDADINAAYSEVKGSTVTGAWTRAAYNTCPDIFAVSYDYDALHTLGAKHVRIIYTTTADEDMEVGVDTNTNTAILHYQKDASGEMTSASDTVTAWTYGFAIIKRDGENNNTLPGAQFTVYHGVAEYYAENGTAASEDNYDDFAFYRSLRAEEESVTVPTGTISDTPDTPLSTLDLYATANTGDVFYEPVFISAAESVNCTHANVTGEHYHIICLEADEHAGTITSTASVTGVESLGYRPGRYLIKEILAPDGYNLMNEATSFDINKLDALVATEDYDGSYRAFVDDDGVNHDTGIYSITVYNFPGLVLPSTGGIGIKIFTVTGTGLMMMALLLIIIKSRKKEEETVNS